MSGVFEEILLSKLRRCINGSLAFTIFFMYYLRIWVLDCFEKHAFFIIMFLWTINETLKPQYEVEIKK